MTSSTSSSSVPSPSPSPSPSPLPWKKWNLLVLCTPPMLGGFLYGFDIGTTSFVLQMMLREQVQQQDSETTLQWWTNISPFQQGLLVSAVSLGALMGSHSVFMFVSKYSISRKRELQLSATLYLIGTALNVLSGYETSSQNEKTVFSWVQKIVCSFSTLIVGRVLFGIGVALVMHAAPAYLAEMCPPQIRGAIVSAKETIIVLGIVMGYVAGNTIASQSQSLLQSLDSESERRSGQWTDLYALSAIGAMPMWFLSFYIPRSKRWLLLHGKDTEAWESMKFIYHQEHGTHTGNENNKNKNRNNYNNSTESISLEASFQTLASQVRMEQENNSSDDCEDPSSDTNENQHQSLSVSKMWKTPAYRPAFVASMGLIFFQQFSGQPSALSYVTVLLDTAGWSGNTTIVTALVMMGASMSTVALVDLLGRKRLLYLCCSVMGLALLTLTILFASPTNTFDSDSDSDINSTTHGKDDGEKVQKMILLIAMFLFIGGYQIGFGPITWTIVSEIFPLDIKGTAIAMCVEMNYLLNFLVQFLLPIGHDTFGWSVCFGIFGTCMGLCIFFVYQHVPETSGLTLEEIQEKLRSKRHDIVDNITTGNNERRPLLSK